MNDKIDDKINKFICSNGHILVTYKFSAGTVPIVIKCPICGEKAVRPITLVDNSYISTKDTKSIDAIWYKPCKEEVDSLSARDSMRVRNGVLLLKLLPSKSFKPLSAKDIKGFKDFARNNYVPGSKLPIDKIHPLVVLECSVINEEFEGSN